MFVLADLHASGLTNAPSDMLKAGIADWQKTLPAKLGEKCCRRSSSMHNVSKPASTNRSAAAAEVRVAVFGQKLSSKVLSKSRKPGTRAVEMQPAAAPSDAPVEPSAWRRRNHTTNGRCQSVAGPR
ncbi:hypothetical protein KCP77_05110 [Salmonella enterica subsp. enterica]|nr:hypothetical protein KCP77_05110 [Salmonella enterica subsp. enterica]